MRDVVDDHPEPVQGSNAEERHVAGSAKTTSSVVSWPSALRIAYPTSRLTICFVAVAKLRLRRGVMPTCWSTSAGNQVSSEPVSTSAAIGGVASSSFFGLGDDVHGEQTHRARIGLPGDVEQIGPEVRCRGTQSSRGAA
jgi:hypothetical protein